MPGAEGSSHKLPRCTSIQLHQASNHVRPRPVRQASLHHLPGVHVSSIQQGAQSPGAPFLPFPQSTNRCTRPPRGVPLKRCAPRSLVRATLALHFHAPRTRILRHRTLAKRCTLMHPHAPSHKIAQELFESSQSCAGPCAGPCAPFLNPDAPLAPGRHHPRTMHLHAEPIPQSCARTIPQSNAEP